MSKANDFVPLRIVRASISNRHTEATDSTGQWLDSQIQAKGHELIHHEICGNDFYGLRAKISVWIADPQVEVIITHGGTGFAQGNCTQAAIEPLLAQTIPGFGEFFRQLSFQQIGSSALQSRAFAGLVNGKVLFAIPGSLSAADLAWTSLISPQLDARQGPCNFVAHIQKGRCNG
ncbi:MAG: molybdopterin-binding protein [Gammaproteobacteria bacterium]|nr:molybdopterin-binding protein [Gammaproteobacteria bacterium]